MAVAAIPLSFHPAIGYARRGLVTIPGTRSMRTISAHRKDVHGLAFAPDGHTLVSVGGQSAAVSVWDARSGDEVLKLRGRRDRGRAVACGPDGLVAAADNRNLVRVWQLPKGDLVAEIAVNRYSPAYDLAFLPDGTGLVTASQEVRVWDLRTADRDRTGERPFVEPPTMHRWFHAACASPDGTRVAFGSLAAVSCWWPATGA